MQCLALRQAYVSAPVRVARRSRAGAVSRRMLVVKAHEEEEVLPIWSGRVEVPDPETLHRGPMLGGKTLGEELVLLREAYNKEEHDKEAEMESKLYSSNWQGDVYVGSNWNMLTLFTGLMFFVPVLGLLFAYLSYGTLWTGHYYGI